MSRGERSQGGALWSGLAPHDAEAPIQRLDARLRILALAAFALLAVSLSHWPTLLAALTVAATLAFNAALPLRATLKALLVLDGFMLLALLLLPFTLPGEPLLSIGPLVASLEGVLRALAIAIKANAVLLAALALVGSLETVALGHALHHLRLPDKLIQLFLFTIRYIDLLGREYQRLRQAMRARAFVARSDWHTWRSYGYLFGMLLVRALARAERVQAAMRCRGFDGHYHRFRHPAAGLHDLRFGLLFGGVLSALLLWEVLA